MRGRIYDPRLARFMQADPLFDLSSTQQLNRYAYVLNNPLNLIDPSGFQGQSAPAAGQGQSAPGTGATVIPGEIVVGPPLAPGEPAPYVVIQGQPAPQAAPATPAKAQTAPPNPPPVPRGDSTSSFSGGGGYFPGPASSPSRSAPSVTVTNLGAVVVPRTLPAAPNVSPLRALASAGLGFIPYLGFLQSLVELLSGWNYLTGEPASRPLAAIAVIASILPGGKGLVKAFSKADDVADARGALVATLGARVTALAEFDKKGIPLILDENVTARGLPEALRAKGYNVRSVAEIFLGRKGVPDEEIIEVAKAIGARVITNNVRDFGRKLAIPMPRPGGGYTPGGVAQIIDYYLK